MKENLFIIGSNGIPARYGGFETFAENLALHLRLKYSIHVACSETLYTEEERKKKLNQVNRFFIPWKGSGPQSVLYDFKSLKYVLRHSKAKDLVLCLGITAGIFLPFWKEIRKRKIIIHIDGLEWTRSKWNFLPRIFLKVAYGFALKYAHQLILDSTALQTYIPKRYQHKIILTSYGADHLPCKKDFPNPIGGTYALAIARAEPENNLEMLIQTFVDLYDLPLIIISNFKETVHGRGLIKKYKSAEKVHLIHAIYNDPGLLQAYRKNCFVYLHAHGAGGTNPSLVEAMYSGIPILCLDNKFNRTTTNDMGYYFNSSKELKNLLNTLGRTELKILARKLESYAQTNYNWESVSCQLMANIRD